MAANYGTGPCTLKMDNASAKVLFIQRGTEDIRAREIAEDRSGYTGELRGSRPPAGVSGFVK